MKRPETRNHNVKSARQCSGAVQLQNVDPRRKHQLNTIEHWWADFTLWRVAAVRAIHTLRQLVLLFGCSTCKSCYNLFHGFVDRQRVTVWSSGCALEHFLRILHSTGVAVWVRVCFGLRLLWVCLGLGLVRFGFALGWTWFDWACFGWDLVLCFRSRYKLISRAWAKSSVLRNCTQTLVIENTATLYRHNEKTQLDQVSSWTCMLSDLHLRSASLPLTSGQQSNKKDLQSD